MSTFPFITFYRIKLFKVIQASLNSDHDDLAAYSDFRAYAYAYFGHNWIDHLNSAQTIGAILYIFGRFLARISFLFRAIFLVFYPLILLVRHAVLLLPTEKFDATNSAPVSMPMKEIAL